MNHPFSIHNIAREGAKMGRNPGDWYGPQAIMVVLKNLIKMYDPVMNFKMIVAREGNIFLDKIEAKSENWKNAVFVAVPVRLGLNHIEPEYL